MAKMIDINLNPDRKTLRSFGYVAFVGFGMLAAMAWTESFLFTFGLGGARSTVAGVFAALAVFCLIAGLVFPAANKPVFVGLSVITFPIGIVLSYVIMLFLFFGLFGLIGAMMRLVGYDPMSRKKDSSLESYWSEARPPRPRSDYFKQY